MLEKIEIPIIEESENGKHYYLIYSNGRRIKKNNIEPMVNPILEQFKKYKESQSPFITLREDGETVTLKVKEIKTLSKLNPRGQETEVIRLVGEVDGKEKFFDNGQRKWVEDLIAKEVDVGSVITITRRGAKGDTKTVYEIVKS